MPVCCNPVSDSRILRYILFSRYAEEIVCCCRIRLVHDVLFTRHSIEPLQYLSSEIAHLAESRIKFRRNTLRTWEDVVLAKPIGSVIISILPIREHAGATEDEVDICQRLLISGWQDVFNPSPGSALKH